MKSQTRGHRDVMMTLVTSDASLRGPVQCVTSGGPTLTDNKLSARAGHRGQPPEADTQETTIKVN